VYLFHPKTRGASVIYEKALRRLLKKYEGEIDSKLQNVGQNFEKVVQGATPMLNNLGNQVKAEAVNRVVEQTLSS